MRICVLHAAYESPDSPFSDVDPPMDPRPWLGDHEVDRRLILKSTVAQQIGGLVGLGHDVFINLCDGTPGEASAGCEAAALALEEHGAPFTGAGSRFAEPSREAVSSACRGAGLRSPDAVVARSTEDAARAARMRFPLIVKHHESYGSIGMTRSSVVRTARELEAEAGRMIAAYGAARIEAFVEGREFTVLVAQPRAGRDEPLALTPLEIGFPPGETFKHFDLKWREHGAVSPAPVSARRDEGLAERLRDVARRAFVALGGDGYARLDLRMDDRGELFVIDVNPNCGLFYAPDDPGSADLVLLNDPLGHRGFLEHIIGCALDRAGAGRLRRPNGEPGARAHQGQRQ